MHILRTVVPGLVLVAATLAAPFAAPDQGRQTTPPASVDFSSLKLPPGFTISLFAEGLPSARQNGDGRQGHGVRRVRARRATSTRSSIAIAITRRTRSRSSPKT
jgi:hypothetical protein